MPKKRGKNKENLPQISPLQGKADREAAESAAAAAAQLAVRQVRYGEKAGKGGGKGAGVKASPEVMRRCHLYRYLLLRGMKLSSSRSNFGSMWNERRNMDICNGWGLRIRQNFHHHRFWHEKVVTVSIISALTFFCFGVG